MSWQDRSQQEEPKVWRIVAHHNSILVPIQSCSKLEENYLVCCSSVLIMSDPFLDHLNIRLTCAERDYLLAQYPTVVASCVDILRDLIVLTSSHANATGKLLAPSPHSCNYNCVCLATVILLIQCYHSTAEYSEIDKLIREYYDSIENLNYNLFLLYINSLISQQQYDSAARYLVKYVEAHTKNESSPYLLSNAEYNQLIELLIFHTLIPQGEYTYSIKFLQSTDNRINKAKRQQWIAIINKLKAELKNEQNKKVFSTETLGNNNNTDTKVETTANAANNVSTIQYIPDPTVNTVESADSSSNSTLSKLRSHIDSLHLRLDGFLESLSPSLSRYYKYLVNFLKLHRASLVISLLIIGLLLLRRLISRYFSGSPRFSEHWLYLFFSRHLTNFIQLAFNSGFGRLFF
jgi:Tfp pilus assembly major pilin PilA